VVKARIKLRTMLQRARTHTTKHPLAAAAVSASSCRSRFCSSVDTLGRRERHRPIRRLSPRELEVLAAMAEGKANRGIADDLGITQAMVEKHVTSIFHKLGLDPG
jgi:DNA-binding NarL/FixJ family response regulator